MLQGTRPIPTDGKEEEDDEDEDADDEDDDEDDPKSINSCRAFHLVDMGEKRQDNPSQQRRHYGSVRPIDVVVKPQREEDLR